MKIAILLVLHAMFQNPPIPIAPAPPTALVVVPPPCQLTLTCTDAGVCTAVMCDANGQNCVTSVTPQ